MANFIEEFFYGNLDPQARSTKQNKAVQKQMEILMNNEEKLTSGKLNGYLADIDIQAEDMFSRLKKQMVEREGITEQLKADNQMEWVARMNNIRSRATEIVNHDIFCT